MRSFEAIRGHLRSKMTNFIFDRNDKSSLNWYISSTVSQNLDQILANALLRHVFADISFRRE